jgi:hypothetical protein
VAAARCGGGTRADHAAGAAGYGIRRARRAAGDHGPVHDDPLPDRVRRVRTFSGPRARPGRIAGADDRGNAAADPRLRRESGARDCARVDARADRRRADARGGDREAWVRRRPAVKADADRLRERPRTDDPDRTAAEAVRVLDRRERADQRGARVRARARIRQGCPRRRRGRRPQPRFDPRACALAATGARGAGSGRGCDRGLGGARSGIARRLAGRSPAQGISAADGAKPDIRPTAARRRRTRDRSRGAGRHNLDRFGVCRAHGPRGRWERRDDRDRRRQRRRRVLPGFPVSTSGSRTAVAEQAGAKSRSPASSGQR